MNPTSPNLSFAIRTAAAAANGPYWQAIAPALVLPATLVERQFIRSLTVVLATAVQTELFLVRAVTNGTPNPEIALSQANRLNNIAGSTNPKLTYATAWSVNPTIGASTTVLSRILLPATVGASASWEFDEQSLALESTAGGGRESLLLWNAGAAPGGILDVTCEVYGE